VTRYRAAFAVAAAGLVAIAVANVAVWNSSAWFAVGVYAVLVLVAAFVEVGRYRTKADPSATWVPTGERFVDPTTGVDTTVFYDPASGKRDYRPS
jgi:uncharacterized membrane protein